MKLTSDADKEQSFLAVDFNTLGIKVFCNLTNMNHDHENVKDMVMRMIKNSQSTQVTICNNKFALS